MRKRIEIVGGKRGKEYKEERGGTKGGVRGGGVSGRRRRRRRIGGMHIG